MQTLKSILFPVFGQLPQGFIFCNYFLHNFFFRNYFLCNYCLTLRVAPGVGRTTLAVHGFEPQLHHHYERKNHEGENSNTNISGHFWISGWRPATKSTTKPPGAVWEGPTVVPEDEGCGWPQDLAVGHSVGHHTGVVAHIRGLHLGDVQIPSLLWHKAPVVLVHKGGVLVEDPGVGQLCKHRGHAVSRENGRYHSPPHEEWASWLLMPFWFWPVYIL